MHQGAEDAAADAGEEEQIWREGEHHDPITCPQPCCLSVQPSLPRLAVPSLLQPKGAQPRSTLALTLALGDS